MADLSTSTIAAEAFIYLGLGSVAALAEKDPKVVDARVLYDRALRIALESADWSFASTRAVLPEAVPADLVADPDLPHVFKLPDTCLVLRDVLDADAWRLDADFLCADRATTLTVRYTGLVQNEKDLPATFQTAVALQLAILMAPKWVEKLGDRDRLRMALDDALEVARRHDARTASATSWDASAEGWLSEATQ